jgi:hypothetical protein
MWGCSHACAQYADKHVCGSKCGILTCITKVVSWVCTCHLQRGGWFVRPSVCAIREQSGLGPSHRAVQREAPQRRFRNHAVDAAPTVSGQSWSWPWVQPQPRSQLRRCKAWWWQPSGCKGRRLQGRRDQRSSIKGQRRLPRKTQQRWAWQPP